jgi:hypothetical protein
MPRRISLLLPILSLLLVIGIAGSVQSEMTTGSATLKKAVFLAEDVQLTNPDTAKFVDAFSTTLTLKGATQCILLMYSGELATTGSAAFQALVDGEIAEGGMPFLGINNSGIYETRAMNWWQCNLGKGQHEIKIQFKPFSGSSTIRKRTLTILYNN